jgi:hypothetical protein
MPLFAVAGGRRPNAIELARIAEVQAVLAFALQRYEEFLKPPKVFGKKCIWPTDYTNFTD